MSLARLWQQQGSRPKLAAFLVPVYGWFTGALIPPISRRLRGYGAVRESAARAVQGTEAIVAVLVLLCHPFGHNGAVTNFAWEKQCRRYPYHILPF